MKNIVNIITQILTYADTVGTTDNPQLRNFDWNRQLKGLSIDNPYSREIRIPPGEEATLFDGLRSNNLDATSVLSLENFSGSTYEIKVDSGTLPGWRTARTITTLTDVNITINNDVVATFEFVGATLGGVQINDIIRVAGDATYNNAPFAFSTVNSGLWVVIGINGNKLQAVRPIDEPFSGTDEALTSVPANQIEIYSADGTQKCDKFEIVGAFSSASYKTFKVKDVTPTRLIFTSTSPLPEETSVAYPDPVANGHSIFVYNNSKKIFYLEADQDISVRFNDDANDNVKITPIQAGNPDLIGYIHKFGHTYKAVVKNKSVNTVKIMYFVAE